MRYLRGTSSTGVSSCYEEPAGSFGLGWAPARPGGFSPTPHRACDLASLDVLQLSTGSSPHSLRHAFGTAALDAGVPLRDVQDAMGHADPRTTRVYDRSRHSLDRHSTYAVAAFLDEGR